ncbi:hypothetical protein Desca_0190 [Desulfotomaculum nigrificans CO-1-SRB]|uniref:Uncharacterized protein n=1 Tax=Desulfotomaculum nigrificans (strain DSM 14880 / VKM B-2319 / CO-1-SRB) TaxID=868595 RepID=F6B575_DESCC|nr:hypothetical protein [Desulfotomaculum nigrificans]AEF93094.1 hypothetical protein Desca_0190 [Desulfotomaculum nigrificans CO-1-SRB]
MKTIPLVIIALWGIALTLGVLGVVARRRILFVFALVAALGGVGLTFWLKNLLQHM